MNKKRYLFLYLKITIFLKKKKTHFKTQWLNGIDTINYINIKQDKKRKGKEGLELDWIYLVLYQL